MPYVSISILYITFLNNTDLYFNNIVIISFCYPGSLNFLGI